MTVSQRDPPMREVEGGYAPITGWMTDGWQDAPLHRVWEYRDIGRLFITVGGKRVIIGVLRWGWVEVILRVRRQSGGHSPQAPATLR